MSLALAFMFQNEAAFIGTHLPLLLESKAIDGVVALDGGSEDNGASVILRACLDANKFVTVFQKRFQWDFSAQANFLISCTEGLGYTHILRVDPDETLFSSDIDKIKEVLESSDYRGLPLAFRRINFEGDRKHWIPAYDPDYQTRAWELNRNFRYTGKVHEQLNAFPNNVHNINIYHYEGTRPNTVQRYEKHHNYSLLSKGEAPVKLPSDFPVPDGFADRPNVLYEGKQPLDLSEVTTNGN